MSSGRWFRVGSREVRVFNLGPDCWVGAVHRVQEDGRTFFEWSCKFPTEEQAERFGRASAILVPS